MTRPILYLAITNHGFGHATRAAAVAAEIQRRNSDILLILVTTAPRWLLESYIPGDFILRPRAFDVGVIQADSLTMDKAATLDKLQHIRTTQAQIIASEATFIRQNQVGLVLADIPPLATAIAHAADVPCWMMSNFGWDLIYRSWGVDFEAIADWIAELFGQCDRLFRLPFHEPMAAFPTITDTGLIGGDPRFSPEEMRDRWHIETAKDKTILLTFGGLGLQQIPYHNIERFPDWQFIAFDRNAPDLPNLLRVKDSNYRPVDFMPLCDRVVSKPGYGTFAEAMKVGVPIASLQREDFAEVPYLMAGLQHYSPHQILSVVEFSEGNWDFLEQSPDPPKTSEKISKDGNSSIANAVLQYFET